MENVFDFMENADINDSSIDLGYFCEKRVRENSDMTSDIKSFVSYLRDVKKTSRNTEISYQRDLMQLKSFLEDKGITEVEKVTKTSLNSYILFWKKRGRPRPPYPGSWHP